MAAPAPPGAATRHPPRASRRAGRHPRRTAHRPCATRRVRGRWPRSPVPDGRGGQLPASRCRAARPSSRRAPAHQLAPGAPARTAADAAAGAPPSPPARLTSPVRPPGRQPSTRCANRPARPGARAGSSRYLCRAGPRCTSWRFCALPRCKARQRAQGGLCHRRPTGRGHCLSARLGRHHPREKVPGMSMCPKDSLCSLQSMSLGKDHLPTGGED